MNRSITIPTRLVTVFAIATCVQATRADRVIYVAAGATGAGNGTSWVDAYVDLQDALAEAAGDGVCTPSSPCEVWVAAGVYKPDCGTGDRNASFFLQNNVALCGGFAGWETARDQRDWTVNESILHGDLLSNDGTTPPPTSNCCYEHDGPGCDDEACAEGVCGAMIWCCWEGNEWDNTCVLQAATGSCPDMCHPDWMDNSRTIVFAEEVDATARLDGFTVTAGFAAGFAPDEPRPPLPSWHFYTGGGMYIKNAAPTVTNCLFHDNAAGVSPAIHVQGDDIDIEITDCTFERNQSTRGGTVGGQRDVLGNTSTLAVTRCTFIESNSRVGTAVFGDSNYSVEVTDCVFKGQGFGTGVAAQERLTVRGSLFLESEGFIAITGGNTALEVADCAFIDNKDRAIVNAGAISSTVERCLFLNNRTPTPSTPANRPVIQTLGPFGSANIRNCLFSGNVGYKTLHVGMTGASMTHCTIVGNQTAEPWGTAGVWVNEGIARIAYCIFRDNRDSEGNVNEVTNLRALQENDQIIVNQTNIEGWPGMGDGVGNFDADPGFVAPGHWDDAGTPDDFSDDRWIGGDYHLAPGSPGIDVSNMEFAGAHFSDTDLDGFRRLMCNAWDQGAYEYGRGDPNCDESIDLTDMAHWTQFFCLTGPDAGSIRPTCESFDFDVDIDIDLTDFAAFQRVFSP